MARPVSDVASLAYRKPTAPGFNVTSIISRWNGAAAPRTLHLHIHDVGVGGNQLVADLNGSLKRNVSLLHRDHRILERNTVLPGLELMCRGLGLRLRGIDLIERTLQNVEKRRGARGSRRCFCARIGTTQDAFKCIDFRQFHRSSLSSGQGTTRRVRRSFEKRPNSLPVPALCVELRSTRNALQKHAYSFDRENRLVRIIGSTS